MIYMFSVSTLTKFCCRAERTGHKTSAKQLPHHCFAYYAVQCVGGIVMNGAFVYDLGDTQLPYVRDWDYCRRGL